MHEDGPEDVDPVSGAVDARAAQVDRRGRSVDQAVGDVDPAGWLVDATDRAVDRGTPEGERLGYLIVTPLPQQQLVVVRTFKFLTMGNTPEQRKLMKVFKMSRGDVDWLRLASLDTFTKTDLGEDDLLREKLEACGCGHLFTLDWTELVLHPQPFAAEMRKYLRLAA